MTQAAETEAWLRLGLIPQLGPATFRKLLADFGNPESAIAASKAALARSVGDALADAIARGPDSARLRASLDWLQQPAHRLLTMADADYPSQLLEIADPPPVLFLKGNPALLRNHQAIAVVGSRHATRQGEANAEAFARDLADRGFTIISGLATGVDAAAHLGGLRGQGSSIAVVGTGLDIVYPARNRELAHALADTGLLMSEFAIGTKPLSGNFPRRNRLLSGLARGVLVVEAALKSGSLITARHAIDQGREVFAIPGSIHSPQSRGCHLLIRQGAKLVECATDILEEFGMQTGLRASPVTPSFLPKHASLIEALGYDPVDLDSICARSGLTPENASAMLLELELEGHVARAPGGKFQRMR